MKYVCIVILINLNLIACSDLKSTKVDSDFFNEDQYESVRIKNDDFGKKISEFFVNKTDKSRMMIKLYWDNGKVQSVAYLVNGEKNGPSQEFDNTGKLFFSGFYFKNKETGISCYYNPDGSLKKLEVIEDGKVINRYNDSLYKIK
jgi:antitoxin component YwqK of YwqJK toxin-antitoxin module